MSSKNKKINLQNTRTRDQKIVMERIMKDGVCPFCRKHFKKYHTKPIHSESTYWIVTENAWPYKNTKHHFLLILQSHVAELKKITGPAWTDLHKQIKLLQKKYSVNGGTLLMRSGMNSSTVQHLHAHFIVAQSDRNAVRTHVG